MLHVGLRSIERMHSTDFHPSHGYELLALHFGLGSIERMHIAAFYPSHGV